MKSGSSWGLSITNSKGTPTAEWLAFSKAESDKIIRAVKTRLGPQYTISHLGHAATMLALLKTNPLPSDADDDTALIMPLPVNGRRFLRDKYVGKQYGACQASAVVEFENLKSWVVDLDDAEAVRSALERGCKHVKASYDYWLSMEFGLALGVSKDNFLSAFLSSAPPSEKSSSIPIFVSDGMIDRYVPARVLDVQGERLLTIEKCRFFVDTYGSELLVRMDSFKGVTAFSFCFNDGHYSPANAAAFLRQIASFMLQFAE